MNYKLVPKVIPILIGLTILLTTGLKAASSDSLSDLKCPKGQNTYINFSCQQKKLVNPERLEIGFFGKPIDLDCDVYYCAVDGSQANVPNSANFSLTDAGKLDVDAFETSLELDSPEGIATLVTVSIQMFLGIVAIVALIMAVRAALLMSKAGDANAYEQARKIMTYGLVGLFICGAAMIILQFMANFLGLGDINDVFEALGPAFGQ